MPAHFIAGQSHWFDHEAPVYRALPEEIRGTFYVLGDDMVRYADEFGITAERLPTWPHFARHDRVVIASESDRRRVETVPTIRFEHGVGGSFNGSAYTQNHPSYAGGKNQRNVKLFCCTNRYSSGPWSRAYPHVPVRVVGTPKMDRWFNAPPKPRESRPVVCIGFHFDAGVAPEARSAFTFYHRVIPELAKRNDIELVATAHPKAVKVRRRWYENNGIEFVQRWDDVMGRADLYVVDSFSTLYEFAAADRPVVVLNAPFFRRNVHHGLRFWELSDVGVNVDRPDDLSGAIDAALLDPPEQQERRHRATEILYPYPGRATERAVEVFAEHFAREEVKV